MYLPTKTSNKSKNNSDIINLYHRGKCLRVVDTFLLRKTLGYQESLMYLNNTIRCKLGIIDPIEFNNIVSLWTWNQFPSINVKIASVAVYAPAHPVLLVQGKRLDLNMLWCICISLWISTWNWSCLKKMKCHCWLVGCLCLYLRYYCFHGERWPVHWLKCYEVLIDN
jgi:hypothetical protein